MHCLRGQKKVAVVDIHSIWRYRNGRGAQQEEMRDTGAGCIYIILQVAELSFYNMPNLEKYLLLCLWSCP